MYTERNILVFFWNMIAIRDATKPEMIADRLKIFS